MNRPPSNIRQDLEDDELDCLRSELAHFANPSLEDQRRIRLAVRQVAYLEGAGESASREAESAPTPSRPRPPATPNAPVLAVTARTSPRRGWLRGTAQLAYGLGAVGLGYWLGVHSLPVRSDLDRARDLGELAAAPTGAASPRVTSPAASRTARSAAEAPAATPDPSPSPSLPIRAPEPGLALPAAPYSKRASSLSHGAPGSASSAGAAPSGQPPQHPDFDEILERLRRAEAALRAGEATRAMLLLEALDRDAPGPELREERWLTQVLTWCALRQPERAAQVARALRAHNPTSIYRARLQASCAETR